MSSESSPVLSSHSEYTQGLSRRSRRGHSPSPIPEGSHWNRASLSRSQLPGCTGPPPMTTCLPPLAPPGVAELCTVRDGTHTQTPPGATPSGSTDSRTATSLPFLSLLSFSKCLLGNSREFPQTPGQGTEADTARSAGCPKAHVGSSERARLRAGGPPCGKGPEHPSELTEPPGAPRAGRPSPVTDRAGPSPGPRHSGFTHEFPLRNASRWPCTASGRQPPQGQFQGRNCFGLGFGSENKHSGFYRFTRVGCCFPFQQLLNQAFHSEASGL